MIQNTVMSIYRKADEKKQNIFENLYLLFFVMITVMAFKDTTMFSYGWTDTQLHLVFIFGVLVVFAKISCGRPWKLYEILIAGIAAGVLILCWHHYMRRYVLELAVLIIGARDVDSDKVIRVFLWVSTGCLLVTMAAALTGKNRKSYLCPERTWRYHKNIFWKYLSNRFFSTCVFFSSLLSVAEGSKYPVQRYYLYGLSWCVLSVFLRSKDKRSGALDFGAFLPVEEKRNSEGKQENTESRCFLYAGLCSGLYTSGTALQSGLRLDETSEQNPEYAAVTGT